MSRDKQAEIDEIADLERLLRIRQIDIFALLKRTTSEEQAIAEYLVGHNYRKASSVAEEIFSEIEKRSEVALMNGHIETPILCIGFGVLAELKKKYTEGGNE